MYHEGPPEGILKKEVRWSENVGPQALLQQPKSLEQMVNPTAVLEQLNMYQMTKDTTDPTDYGSQPVACAIDDYDLYGCANWNGEYFPPDDFCGDDE